MFGIFEVLNIVPSGRPQKDWKDYTIRDGKFHEKRMLGTSSSEEDAINRVTSLKCATKNDVYYTNLD